VEWFEKGPGVVRFPKWDGGPFHFCKSLINGGLGL
jgi:hypothetical protein